MNNLQTQSMKTIDRALLQSLMEREQKKFVDERPKSKTLFERGRKSLLAGVPMKCHDWTWPVRHSESGGRADAAGDYTDAAGRGRDLRG